MVPPFIMTARHAHPNVRTDVDYRARQREAIAGARRHYPNLPWRDPWVSIDVPLAFVSGGRLVVECTTAGCGNCPMVAPAWGREVDDVRLALACCYECGATYDLIVIPDDFPAIEAALVLRPTLAMRYWNPAVTVDDLHAANVSLGAGARG